MRKTPKKFAAFFCAAVMMLSLCACGESNDENEIEGQSAGQELKQTTAADDVFTLNYNSGYSLNPITATNISNQVVCNLVYENMIEVDNNFEAMPNVITSWTTEDGKTWTFTVANDRYFHDGSQLTAYDVAYSLNCARYTDRFKNRLSVINGVSVNGADSFNVSIGRTDYLFPNLLAVPVIKDGSFESEFPQGSGPYAFSKNHKKLQAYKKYFSYNTLPLKTIYLAEYNTVDSTISAFEDSLIDIVMNDPTAPTNIGYGSKNEIRGYNTTNLHYIGFNLYGNVFSYDFMRAAVSLAFDRETIVTEQLGGYGLATTQVISPASQYYSATVDNQNKYNMEKAQRILKNAGLKDHDGDGFLEIEVDENNYQKLEISFVVCNTSAIKVNVARKFAEDMKEIGVKVNVFEQAWDLYTKTVEAGNFDMYYGEVKLNADFDPSRLLCVKGKLNYCNIADSKLEEYINAYLSAVDDERFDAAETMSAYICNKAYIAPILFEKHQMITHRGLIEGIQITENNPLNNFRNWEISFAENISGSSDKKK